MSEHRDKMRRRMEAKGFNEGDALRNNVFSFADKEFENSPAYRRAGVISTQFPEIEEIDVRVMSVERMGDIREVLFRPFEGLNIGCYLTFDGDTWMVYDRYGSLESGKTKVMVERCTEELRWSDTPDIHDSIERVPCVASATQLGSKANQGKNLLEWNKYDVRLALGQIFVFVEKNPKTETVRINQRFILGSNAYEVVGLDDVTSVTKDGFGYIQMTLSVTTKRDEDNFDPAYKCAYNDLDELPTDEQDKGGRIW